MGHTRHHAIIVTACVPGAVEAARAKALEIFPEYLVGPMVGSRCNEWNTFLVGPDGSSLDWARSDRGVFCRGQFTSWLSDQADDDGDSTLSWVEVFYGDDDGICRIVRDCGEIARRENQS